MHCYWSSRPRPSVPQNGGTRVQNSVCKAGGVSVCCRTCSFAIGVLRRRCPRSGWNVFHYCGAGLLDKIRALDVFFLLRLGSVYFDFTPSPRCCGFVCCARMTAASGLHFCLLFISVLWECDPVQRSQHHFRIGIQVLANIAVRQG